MILLGCGAMVGCGPGSVRHELRTGALFPTLGPLSSCRVTPGPVELIRGHVVLVEVEGQRTVRRIVGLPGDTVSVAGGVLHIGGKTTELTETTARAVCMAGASPRCPCRIHVEAIGDRKVPVQSLTRVAGVRDVRCQPSPGAREVTVPAGHVYVLADNRDAAIDSRHLGPLPLGRLLGRVVACKR